MISKKAARKLTEAWGSGYDAFEEGLKLTDNPFGSWDDIDVTTMHEWSEWHSGYLDHEKAYIGR